MTQLLLKSLHRFTYQRSGATWRSGYATVCKTVYPGSIPGVASTSINGLGQALRREASLPRASLFQHRCLQTSCWVVQLRLQALLPVAAAGFVVTAAVVGTQEFWQFMACVSQLT